MTTLTFDASSDPILERRREIQGVAAASLRRRKVYSKIAVGVCWAFLVIAIVPLVAVVVYVVVKGLPAWSADFFTHPTYPEGIPGGGVWNAIVGTAEIGLIATAVTVPLGLLCGLFLAAVGRPDRRRRPLHRRRDDRGPLHHHRHLRVHRHRQELRLQRTGRCVRHRDRHAPGDHPGRRDGASGACPTT